MADNEQTEKMDFCRYLGLCDKTLGKAIEKEECITNYIGCEEYKRRKRTDDLRKKTGFIWLETI